MLKLVVFILLLRLMDCEVIKFSQSVLSNSLRPYGLQHASLPVHYQPLK